MKRYTIWEIKRIYQRKNPDGHYFDRDTLRFFGQILGDFRVKHIDKRVFIYCWKCNSVYNKWKSPGTSLAEFFPESGTINGITPDEFGKKWLDNFFKEIEVAA